MKPSPVVSAADVSVCQNGTVSLSATGASMYNWSPSDGLSSTTGSSVNFVSGQTTTYTVTGTSSLGCTSTDLVTVTVNPNPVVSFSPGNTLGCAPFETTLTNTTTDAVECLWSISSGEVFSGCGTVPVYFAVPGCYGVTLTTTNSNQCTSTLSLDDLICVEPSPLAQFTSNESVLTTTDTRVEFYNESSGAVSYQWNFGTDNQIYSQDNPIFTFPSDKSGDYLVTLVAISSVGCRDTAFSVISVKEALIFYIPNSFTPDDDDFNQTFRPIFTSGFDPEGYTLYIFDRWGELIFESRNTEVGWDGSYGTWAESKRQVDMCVDGTYTWKIEFKVSKDDERKVVLGHVNLIR